MNVSRRGFFGALAGIATFGLWKRPEVSAGFLIQPMWLMRDVMQQAWVTRDVSVATTRTMRIPTRVSRG